MICVPYTKLLTNLACSTRTGEYWPLVVPVQTLQCSVRTAMTSGQYSPVRPSRSVSKRLIVSLFTHVNKWALPFLMLGWKRLPIQLSLLGVEVVDSRLSSLGPGGRGGGVLAVSKMGRCDVFFWVKNLHPWYLFGQEICHVFF